MLIRSQNNKTITKFDSIYIFPNYKKNRDGRRIIDGYLIYASKNRLEFILGTYSTEEKAIKVLDMIYEQYQLSIHNCKVFQMPQDCEV